MTKHLSAEALDALWNYGDPAESEARFRGILRDLTPGSAEYVEALTQTARAQGLQRRFETAHATLDEAAKMLDQTQGRAQARYLLERGRVFRSSGQPERAGPLFRQALEAAQAAGEIFYAVDAAHMLGIVEGGEGAVAWNLRAMAMAEQASEPRARDWLGSLYNNLGWTFHDQGDFARSLELFEKALAFREAKGQAAETRIARWCVARCWRSLGRLEEALAAQRELLRQQTEGARDGFVLEEMGECLLALGRAEEARPFFAEAYAELSQDEWLMDNEPRRIERLKSLAAPK
jgi:tetratricopeptide (TPR) repeat protein